MATSDPCACLKYDLNDVLPWVPVGYGQKCAAHDQGFLFQCKIIRSQTDTFANGKAYLANAIYCEQPWCYVNGTTCPSAVATFTGEPDLHYSYAACGADDYYTPFDRKCQCIDLLGTNGYGVYRWPSGEFEQGNPVELLEDDPRKGYERFYLNTDNRIPYVYLEVRTANSFAENAIARSSIFTAIQLYDSNVVDLEFNYAYSEAWGSTRYCITSTQCPTAWQSPFVSRGEPEFPLDIGLPFTSVGAAKCGREIRVQRQFPRNNGTIPDRYPRARDANLSAIGGASRHVGHWRQPHHVADGWPSVIQFLENVIAHVVEHVLSLDGCRYECDLRAACQHIVYYAVEPLLRPGDVLEFDGLLIYHERTGRHLPRFPNEDSPLKGRFVVDNNVTGEIYQTITVNGASMYNLPSGRCAMLGAEDLAALPAGPDDWYTFNGTRLTKAVTTWFTDPPFSLQRTVNSAIRYAQDVPILSNAMGFLFGNYNENVDVRPQDTSLSVAGIAISALQSTKTDTWHNYIVDGLAITSVTLSMVMDRSFNFHARLFVPNVIAAYTPTGRVCNDVAVTVDNDLLDASAASRCPRVAHSRGRGTSFHDNALSDYAMLHDEKVVGTRDNIMRYYLGTCKELERQQVVYNGTHVFVIFGYTSDDTWEDNVDAWNGTSLQFCRHPYLTGRVHCGLLRVAQRRLVKLVDDTLDDAEGDLCRVVMQGTSCTTPPTWVFAGTSQGASSMVIFMELLRTFVRIHYGISLDGIKKHIFLLQPSAIGDASFVQAYETHFALDTTIFADRSDPFVLASQTIARHPNTKAFITSSIGACGSEPALLFDCIEQCDLSNPETWGGCIAALLTAGNAAEHYSTPLKLLRYDGQIPDEYLTSDNTFNYDVIGFVTAVIDSVMNAGQSNTCLDELFEAEFLPHTCASEINDAPWEINSVAALAAVLRGEIYQWCVTQRARLQERIRKNIINTESLTTWDGICCSTANTPEDADSIFVQSRVAQEVVWGSKPSCPQIQTMR